MVRGGRPGCGLAGLLPNDAKRPTPPLPLPPPRLDPGTTWGAYVAYIRRQLFTMTLGPAGARGTHAAMLVAHAAASAALTAGVVLGEWWPSSSLRKSAWFVGECAIVAHHPSTHAPSPHSMTPKNPDASRRALRPAPLAGHPG